MTFPVGERYGVPSQRERQKPKRGEREVGNRRTEEKERKLEEKRER